MPNTLTEKALQQPFRVGIMLGALVLPSLWTLSLDAWCLMNGDSLLTSKVITQLFAIGFLPGMILGAGAVRAWAAWRTKNLGQARRILLGHSIPTTICCVAFTIYFVWSEFPGLLDLSIVIEENFWSDIAWLFYFNFPLQVALFMFLLGLFMRGDRA